ncbi:MAG: HAD-IA family hydrolase [Clostridia bacterium]|nr:HAD-IA family hydrolase [Clostridia bacterium]
MVKAILFDLDGTLLDTSSDIQKLLNECLLMHGLPGITPKETRKFIGNGARALVERAVKERADLVDVVLSDYVPRFAVCDNCLTRLFEGEAEFLTAAKRKGVKMAVVTNKPQRATENVCSQFLSEFSFDLLLGAKGDYPLKPSPDGTYLALETLGLSACDALFVGDGETDIETARAAGVRCVSALWGYRSKEELMSFGAKEFAESFSDLMKFID